MSTGAGHSGALTRALAARAVSGVLAAGRTLDEALKLPGMEALGISDRAQVRALAFGAVRWHHRHRCLLDLLLDRPLRDPERLLEALLSVGLFQLLDARQPDYAAVSATVEAARTLGLGRAAGLVNATLRRLQREKEPLLARVLATPEGRHSHPGWLIAQLHHDWPQHHQQLLDAAQLAPPLWLRINRLRTDRERYGARLAAAGIEARTADELPHAVRLVRPLPVEAIPGFAAGEVTVQDAGSQLAAPLLDPAPGMRVLDACAAPGGKTTHLLEHAGGRLDLLALDIEAERLARLRENLVRLALEARLLAADALQPGQWWNGEPFDRILLDAPCSATGVIRRHPDIKLLRRPGDIAAMAERQLALLEALWPLLRPGGRLLYVTCSLLQAESGEVAARFLAAHADAQLQAAPPGRLPAWAVAQPQGGWQVFPGAADTDGYYYVLMARH